RTAEIVVNRHVAAAERDAQPQRRRQPAVGAGVLGVGGDRLTERLERQIVFEIVGMVRRLGPERLRCRISGSGYGSRGNERGTECDAGAFLAAHPPILRCHQLAPLVPITYNRPRLWTKPAFIRAANTRTFTWTATANITWISGSGASTCSRSITR